MSTKELKNLINQKQKEIRHKKDIIALNKYRPLIKDALNVCNWREIFEIIKKDISSMSEKEVKNYLLNNGENNA